MKDFALGALVWAIVIFALLMLALTQL